MKQNDTNNVISKRLDYFNMFVPGAGCGMVCKTGILLVIETTWEFRNTAWLVCFPGSCIICAATELPNRPFEEWSPESKRKFKKSAAPGAV